METVRYKRYSRSKDANVGEGAGILEDTGKLARDGPVRELLLVVNRSEFSLQVINHSFDAVEVQDIVL